jgi:hypothetical protein
MNVALQDLPEIGAVSLDMIFGLDGADAAAMGRMQQALETVGTTGDPMAMYSTIEGDIKRATRWPCTRRLRVISRRCLRQDST